MDRYQLAQRDAGDASFPTRAEWDGAKAELIRRGFLDKRGTLTVAGRNAAPRN